NVSLVLPSSNHISRLRLLHRNAFRAPSTSVLGFDLSRIEGSWSKEPLWWGGIQAASGLARMRSIRLLIPNRDREGAVVNSYAGRHTARLQLRDKVRWPRKCVASPRRETALG